MVQDHVLLEPETHTNHTMNEVTTDTIHFPLELATFDSLRVVFTEAAARCEDVLL